MSTFKIDGKTVFISGDLSINEGESLFNFFKDFPFSSENISIDLTRADSWDTSSVQTFISWMKTTEMEITWKNIPKELMDDLKLMGLASYFKGVKNE